VRWCARHAVVVDIHLGGCQIQRCHDSPRPPPAGGVGVATVGAPERVPGDNGVAHATAPQRPVRHLLQRLLLRLALLLAGSCPELRDVGDVPRRRPRRRVNARTRSRRQGAVHVGDRLPCPHPERQVRGVGFAHRFEVDGDLGARVRELVELLVSYRFRFRRRLRSHRSSTRLRGDWCVSIDADSARSIDPPDQRTSIASTGIRSPACVSASQGSPTSGRWCLVGGAGSPGRCRRARRRRVDADTSAPAGAIHRSQ